MHQSPVMQHDLEYLVMSLNIFEFLYTEIKVQQSVRKIFFCLKCLKHKVGQYKANKGTCIKLNILVDRAISVGNQSI